MVQFYKAPKNTNKNASKSINKQTMSVTIDTMSSHGEGVCLSHKPAIFVEGGLPNETLDIHIVKKYKNHWQAKAKRQQPNVSQLNPNRLNPNRTEPFCDYFHQCGGCATQHCQPQAMLEYKQTALHRQFQKTLGLTELPWLPPIQSLLKSDQYGYRRKARLAIDARNPKSIKLGFRSAGSSDIVTIPNCPVLETELQAIMVFLHENIVQRPNLQTANAQTSSDGDVMQAIRHVGHITLMKVDGLSSITVKLVKDLSEKGLKWWQDFEHRIKECINPNVLLQLIQPSVQEDKQNNSQQTILADITRISANDFIQVNEPVNRAMIERVCREFSENLPVLDLFCGLGNFTLPLSKSAKSVIGVEVSEDMVRKARAIALKSGIENATFTCRDLNVVNGIVDLLSETKVNVLLDPSREGALAVCEQLNKKVAAKIVYISCNPQTWQRDAKVLLNNGYSLSSLMLMDMFPYTPHSELFSVFTHS